MKKTAAQLRRDNTILAAERNRLSNVVNRLNAQLTETNNLVRALSYQMRLVRDVVEQRFEGVSK